MTEPNEDELRVVVGDAGIVLRLHEREVQILQWVFADLARALQDEARTGPIAERLFPRAYLDPTEERAEAEWQSLTHDDLVENRMAALGSVGAELERATPATGSAGMLEVALDAEHAEQWLGVINDARLAIGTAIGVTAESDFDELDPESPYFELHALYDWLTHLLGSLLGGLSGPDAAGDPGDEEAEDE